MFQTFQEVGAFRVLVIEDDLDHAELIRRTLTEHPSRHEILHLTDGEEAQNFLRHMNSNDEFAINSRPHIILLDLRLPKISGHDLLSMIKGSSSLQTIPVIILTTSKAPEDMTQAYLGHANSFLTKPQDFESFSTLVELIGTYWLDKNAHLLSHSEESNTILNSPISHRKIQKRCYSILLVEDDDNHAELICRTFKEKSDSFNIRHVASLAQARESISEFLPELIIIDFRLPDGDGLELIPLTKEEAPYPTIIITGQGDEDIAVEAMKAGALDYIVKSPNTFADIPELAERTIREWDVMMERKRVHEALRRREQQIRQAHKMEAIGTLAGGIAHDFNNILAAILGFNEVSLLKLAEDHPIYRNLLEVSRAGLRAKQLIEQILVFSRQTNGPRQPTLLHRLVEEVLQLIRATLPATIEVRTNLLTTSGTMLADSSQIHQVLINLCTNAEQAMRIKGDTLEITLEETMIDLVMTKQYPSLQPGPHLRLTICDNGEGMSSDVLAHIFDPFFTTKEVGQGTGLGLSVAHGIVSSHQGAITAQSEVGQGSTFTIYFPQVESALETPPDRMLPYTTLEKRHILFVDDEEPLAQLGKTTLEHFGYEVTIRTSSLETLAEFLTTPNKYDLVIMDQTMPKMTGETLAIKLLNIRPNLPIILCTGFSHVMTPERATALGIQGYLVKPILPQDLIWKVNQLLGNANDFFTS